MEKAEFTIVSEWMANGNIMEYIQKNAVNRLQLVRGFLLSPFFAEVLQQLHEAALGLEYIHGAGLTHGDLKGVGVFLL